MDGFAVISDLTKNEKWGTGNDITKPVFSILDPEYTFTVSARQTAAGTADIMSHTFENYFTTEKGAYLQARFCPGIIMAAGCSHIFTYGIGDFVCGCQKRCVQCLLQCELIAFFHSYR